MKKLYKSIVLALFLLALSMFVFVGCNNSGGATPTTPDNDTEQGGGSNNNDDNNSVTASYIAHRYMQYDETNNRFRFSFALQDENENDIAINATVEMRIENIYGTVVYTGTKYVYEDDYREWYNAFNRWLGTAVYIPINEIDFGTINIGTLYYKVTVPDGTYFQYSIEIDEGLPVEEITLGINDVWNIPNNWNFTIEKVETHYACGSESEYRNNNLAQYIMITYSYENIGFDYYSSGLQFNFTDFKVCDDTGEIGEFYGCYTHTNDDEYVNIGMKCSAAQLVFGLNNQSSTVRIDVSHFSDYGELKATFLINIDEHIHNFGEWKITKQATCTTKGCKERLCHCGIKETVEIETINHNYDNGVCTVCGATDPNYKTPDILLGEYVTQNGMLQSNGKYMISWSPNDTTVTQIYWDPSEETLLFAEQQTTTIGITTAGIIYEYGANKQKITVINDQTALGNKITGIGYIYSNTYKPSNNSIYSYSCDATGSLATSNKSLAEACINFLVTHIDDFLDEKTDFDIKDFGFTQWPY